MATDKHKQKKGAAKAPSSLQHLSPWALYQAYASSSQVFFAGSAVAEPSKDLSFDELVSSTSTGSGEPWWAKAPGVAYIYKLEAQVKDLQKKLVLAKSLYESKCKELTTVRGTQDNTIPRNVLCDVSFLKHFRHELVDETFSRFGNMTGSTEKAARSAVSKFGFNLEELSVCVMLNDSRVWSFTDFAKALHILPVPHTAEPTPDRIRFSKDFMIRGLYEKALQVGDIYPSSVYVRVANRLYCLNLTASMMEALWPEGIPLPEISRKALDAYVLPTE